MNSIITRIGLVVLTCFALGCSQIFEEDISDQQLNVIAPANNIQTPYYNQTFWWEKIDGATQYRLQIVSPSFEALELLILDTTSTADKFSYTLKPGRYQWRMRAENYNYVTEYVTRDLVIDTASLDIQYPTLLLPLDNSISTNATFNFSWIPIFGATKYYIEIEDVAGNFITPTKKDSTANSYYSFTLPSDGKYKWRVRGTDGSLYTSWSDVRYFELDRVRPATVSLNNPGDDAHKSNPVQFDWAAVADAHHYKFYLYKQNGITLYSSVYPLTVTTTNTTVQNISNGIVYWTVTAVDAAGNESVAATNRKLNIP